MIDIFSFVLFAILALLIVFGLIRGAMRGGLRAGIRLGMVVLCAVAAFLCAQPVADALLEVDIASLEIMTEDGNLVTGTLGDLLRDTVATAMGEDIYNDVAEASPTVVSLITSVICAVVAEIVFIVAFYVFKLITYIAFCIVRIFIPKRDRNGVKLKRKRLVGMLFGTVQAFVILLVLLVPVTGIVSIAEKAEAALAVSAQGENENTASLNGDGMTSLLSSASDGAETDDAMSLSAITDGMAYSLIKNTGVDKLTVGVFDRMYRFEVAADGEKAYLILELEKLIPMATDIVVMANEESVTADQVCAFLEKIEDSALVTGIVSDFLRTASAHWSVGETYFGIALDAESVDPENPYTAEVLREICAEFAMLDRAGLVADIAVVREIVTLMDENEVMELLTQLFAAEEGDADTEEGEPDEEDAVHTLEILMQILEKKTEHEDGTTATLSADLFTTFSESPRFKVMIPALLNLGIYSATSSLALPMDDAEMYDLMIAELSAALEGVQFDYNAVNEAILYNTSNADYDMYMDAYKKVMRVISNRGLVGYDGAHVYPIGEDLYAYMGGEWTSVSHETHGSTAAIVADALIRAAVVGDMMDENGIIRVAASLTNGGESAAHLADRNVFVSEHATFRKIEIDGAELHEYDYPRIGEALAHMMSAFIDVLEHTEDNGVDANVFLSFEYNALGTALDDLYSIDAMKDLCYGLMDVVTNMTDLEDQQSVRNAVTNLKTNLETGDTTFTKFFGAVGAAVQISNRIESTDHIADLDWSESLKDLSDADEVSLGVVKEMLGGITNAEESTQTSTDMTNLMGTLIDSVNNNFKDADEETFEKEGEALKNTIAALEQSSSISDVIKGVAANSADSALVKDVMLEAVVTAGDRINKNEEYLSINFSRDEIIKTETGESNEGSELMGAVIDSLTQMEEEHFTNDMATLGNVMETLENAGVDFSAEFSADKVTEVMADETIRADVIAALQGSQNAGSTTFDALLSILKP